MRTAQRHGVLEVNCDDTAPTAWPAQLLRHPHRHLVGGHSQGIELATDSQYDHIVVPHVTRPAGREECDWFAGLTLHEERYRRDIVHATVPRYREEPARLHWHVWVCDWPHPVSPEEAGWWLLRNVPSCRQCPLLRRHPATA